jgi:hypothetical protein
MKSTLLQLTSEGPVNPILFLITDDNLILNLIIPFYRIYFTPQIQLSAITFDYFHKMERLFSLILRLVMYLFLLSYP